ncbi:MAG: UMP kinase [Spirochaetes bacterium]|nr:UMP kinase [Spirochaetota bacterium]
MPRRRVLLKISGEALLGSQEFGIDSAVVNRIAAEISEARTHGVEIALIMGGGNIFRGAEIAGDTLKRATADAVGMLATVMNALTLADGFSKNGIPSVVLSAVAIGNLVPAFERGHAMRLLSEKNVVLIPGGTSNPFFTTDTAAVLRALETECDIVFKGTKVDGVYSADPKKHADAVRYEKLSYNEAIEKRLMVMDTSAFTLARDHNMPICVFDMQQPGNIAKALAGEVIGTIVS